MNETEDKVLSPGEVAKIFRVDSKTVNRWAKKGKIPSFRTLGGHYRFYESDVVKAMQVKSTDE